MSGYWVRNTPARKTIYAGSYDPSKDTEPFPSPIPKSPELREKLFREVRKISYVDTKLDSICYGVVDLMTPRPVKKGEVMIEEDKPCDYFYAIEKGHFEQTIKGVLDKTMKDEGSFAEFSLLYGGPQDETVKAMTDGLVWEIKNKLFRRYVLRQAWLQKEDHLSFLKSMPLLQSLTDEERVRLSFALKQKVFKDGTKIIQQGDEADGMYFVEEGKVRVLVRSAEGVEKEVSTLSKGDFFGELALLTKKPRAATIVADGDVQVAFMETVTFERMMGQCEELNRGNRQIFPSRKQRLAGWFRRFFQRIRTGLKTQARKITNVYKKCFC